MQPKPTNDYGHGQMMGMLVVIELFNKARENQATISQKMLDDISKIAVADLSEYLQKPEEDVYLMVDNELKEMK